MKRKLKIENLTVETFAVSEQAADARGTVRAFARPSRQETICQFTCLPDACVPTFVYSCGNPDTQCD